MPEFDVIIVGGGPIGIACGLEAQKKGLPNRPVQIGIRPVSKYEMGK